MAVVQNMWLRGAKQRLAGAVLYQNNGQTLIRELAASVSNPRTAAQMTQRVRLSNCVAVYRANKFWMKYAFEDKKPKESDYNAFIGENISNNAVALTKSEVNAGAAVAAPYTITRGSLGSIEQTLRANMLITNLYFNADLNLEECSVGEFSRQLIAANNGIVEGMQLSFIANIQQTNNLTGVPYLVVRAYEVILDTTNTRQLSEYFPVVIMDVSNTDTEQYCLRADCPELGQGAFAFVLSHTVGGVTRVSTQSLQLVGNTVYDRHTTSSAWQAAIESYGESTETFLDSKSANTAANVAGTVSLLSAEINGTRVYPGSNFPFSIEDGDDVKLVFSQPVNVGAGDIQSFVNVGTSSNGSLLTSESSVPEAGTSSTQFTATLTGTSIPAPYGEQLITLAVETEQGNFSITFKQTGDGQHLGD
ncbi:MAG: hypothetical protein IKG86_00580 [Paludibacteraceae bacterium]|nr:hypothetical protein [Paludibacteraceae bacterium]